MARRHKHTPLVKLRRNRLFDNEQTDEILRSNIEKLKALGRYDENKRDHYGRSDGEQAVATALAKLHIRYVPEYVTEKLLGDTKSFRVVDFYLPKEDLYIEFLGNWNTGDEDKQRYKQKMAVYHRNGLRCIYIFPNQLYNIRWILSEQLRQVKEGTHPHINNGTAQNAESEKQEAREETPAKATDTSHRGARLGPVSVQIDRSPSPKIKPIIIHIPLIETVSSQLDLFRKIMLKISLVWLVLAILVATVMDVATKTAIQTTLFPLLCVLAAFILKLVAHITYRVFGFLHGIYRDILKLLGCSR